MAWSKYNEFSTLAYRLAGILDRGHKNQFARVVEDWTARLFSELPLECGRWLFSHAQSSLTEAQQKQIAGQLNQTVQKDPISENEGTRYQTFIEAFEDPDLIDLRSARPDNCGRY